MTALSILTSGNKPLILDGGLGTTLERERRKDINSPLWSSVLLSTDPASIEDVHLAFLEAGADVILTGTYQSFKEGFESLGHSESKAEELMTSSVDLANNARDTFMSRHPNATPRLVGLALGSFGATIAYQGTEYTGKFPKEANEDFLVNFHQKRLDIFSKKQDQIDFIAFETVPLSEEVRAIRTAVSRTWAAKKPFWIGLTAPEQRWPGGALAKVGQDLWGGSDLKPFAIGLNCTEIANLDTLISELPLPPDTSATLVLYPNANLSFDRSSAQWITLVEGEQQSDDEWANALTSIASKASKIGWRRLIIGGCCGTGIATIASLRRTVDQAYDT